MSFANAVRVQMNAVDFCNCKKYDFRKNCCSRKYLRDAFVKGGTVSIGQTGYHMEFGTDDVKIDNILSRFGVRHSKTARNHKKGIYIKAETDIAEVLSLCGADGARLLLEQTAAARNMNSATQRRVNCDT
ncbi:MAG: DNA-binding protein WhiA, partial [Clostridia bacterium]|nr:DNA-binding protein WhiA [Clostridia bacterium]